MTHPLRAQIMEAERQLRALHREQESLVRALHAQGQSVRAIGAVMGLTGARVHQIIKRAQTAAQ